MQAAFSNALAEEEDENEWISRRRQLLLDHSDHRADFCRAG